MNPESGREGGRDPSKEKGLGTTKPAKEEGLLPRGGQKRGKVLYKRRRNTDRKKYGKHLREENRIYTENWLGSGQGKANAPRRIREGIQDSSKSKEHRSRRAVDIRC